jgi:hypothetical protein
MLSSYDTVKALEYYLIEKDESLTEEEKNEINSYILKIKYENDMNEFNIEQLCI